MSSLSISVNMPIGAAHPSVLGLVSHGLISSSSAAGGGDGQAGLQQGLGPLCPILIWAGCGHSSSWASAAASCAQELLGQAQLVGAAHQMCFGHFTALRVDLFLFWMVGRHTCQNCLPEARVLALRQRARSSMRPSAPCSQTSLSSRAASVSCL